MIVQAEVSLYPLDASDLSEAIDALVKALADPHLRVTTGAMSTHVAGESRIVFDRVSKAFATVAEEWRVALIVKVSNACPDHADHRKEHT